MVVVLADDLGEHVERPGGDHDVVDLGDRGERVGDRRTSPSTRMPIMACRWKPDLERVGDRDDLHDALVEQPLHPLPDGRLGQPDRLADGRVRPPAVLLQLLDDRLGHLVEAHVGAGARQAGHAGHGASRADRRKSPTRRNQLRH